MTIRSSFVSNYPRILILRTEIKSLFWCTVGCIDKLNLARLEQTELFDPIKKIGMNSFSLKEELKEESLKMCNAIQLKKSPIFADELVSSPGMTNIISVLFSMLISITGIYSGISPNISTHTSLELKHSKLISQFDKPFHSYLSPIKSYCKFTLW